jgi:L-lactate dehydrogenase
VAIVGAGNVGSTFAYALLLSGLASEIVLIDKSKAKAEGEAMDLNHSVPLSHPTRIWAGDFSDCSGAAITIIAAGVAQKKGETRLDLVRNNALVFREIVPEVARNNPDGIVLVATNPVDVLTYAAWKLSGLPANRVIGSGTILDTARFRYLLSQHFSVDARSVHAFIVGEHGDSEVPVWSLANIAGMDLQSFSATHGVQYDQSVMDEIVEQTRSAAYRIIERKGATYYAVAIGLLRIVEAVLRNQRTVLSVSSLISDYYTVGNVCLSLPTVIDRSGVERVLRLNLDQREIEGVQHSAQILKTTIAALKLEKI